MNEKFEIIRNNRIINSQKVAQRLDNLYLKLSEVEEGSRAYGVYSQQIRDTERNLRELNDIIEFLRPMDQIDVQHRKDILQYFPQAVKETFPDGFPICFHGTGNIGTVREILRTGGLLTPDQRGVSMTSLASVIDVTYKDNITVSCDFANRGGDFNPYGAIFAFLPQEDEIENVINTGYSTEVKGGVNGVNFREEPHRLFGIITTPENIERVQGWCLEFVIDPSKVYTHDVFIEEFKTKFIESESSALTNLGESEEN